MVPNTGKTINAKRERKLKGGYLLVRDEEFGMALEMQRDRCK